MGFKIRRLWRNIPKIAAAGAAIYWGGPAIVAAAKNPATSTLLGNILASRRQAGAAEQITSPTFVNLPPGVVPFAPGPAFESSIGGGAGGIAFSPIGSPPPAGIPTPLLLTIAGVGFTFLILLLAIRR